MDRSESIFTVVILGLAGANALDAARTISSVAVQAFDSAILNVAFWLWLVTAGFALWCGFGGGYIAVRERSLNNGYLTAFVLLFSVLFEFGGVQFDWSTLGVNITADLGPISLGLNFAGFALLGWLYALRRRATAIRAPSSDPAAA